MNKLGPIIVIEDDRDDQEILAEIFNKLNYPNKIVFFQDGFIALDYLINTSEQPFLILSDINMPLISGFELRDKVYQNNDLRMRCIPYLFFTTATSQKAIIEAYSRSIQGFFVKPTSFKELENTMRKIVEYWQECVSPDAVY
ncbi:response regulator [uncultured Flavobacterium sp.]|uniref:response regulator n=1 Tax=uncultured Flavobacterium sp. TaxID=165435 RepID=UPI0025E53E07|nr:response regulator [uncultured Flavobacterium sp.]